LGRVNVALFDPCRVGKGATSTIMGKVVAVPQKVPAFMLAAMIAASAILPDFL
jgi:hypothetical protein